MLGHGKHDTAERLQYLVSAPRRLLGKDEPSPTHRSRHNGTAYFSALAIVLSNLRDFPGHEAPQQDIKLARFALELFHKVKDISILLPLKSLQPLVAELKCSATLAVEAATEEGRAHRHAEQVSGVTSNAPISESAPSWHDDGFGIFGWLTPTEASQGQGMMAVLADSLPGLQAQW